ncbi:MAG: DNA-binding response regulator, OmpR family, contains REC and winged-helix (wHTH) domain [Chloroflexi bacterium AL-W]|nr:DNA-binding response regulator, OmpR family, contains REC and winged-helix (wHTH) domain [Chloroflexi bacterium AL-N1]NOK66620.1 DNA-binding response regulator, OmpR family, contains REC and winged-helix (wHTH) domain [Chloroflexi bacterium AL-N10]NOK72008.1 DNA-binding response regulator, OmpR family, contains REC and winged-helix (wHTH) domain [Chloroflexi bacterium AL-N5]NOK81265.1 DNA-binding response regulator, OmpR family, contains REC and winged-helix (wHTH) domain [Chloroflexi bacteri
MFMKELLMTTAEPRILLVEDDDSIARIITIGLNDLQTPFQLDHAISAEEALTLADQQSYDLLLTDYNLRGKTGLDLIHQLKDGGSLMPMVLFTAYDTPKLRRDARDAGVTKFVTKPFFVDQFVALARKLLLTAS